MTDLIKISQLPAATTPLTGAENVPLVQSGVTKRATVTQIGTVTATGSTTPRTLANRFTDVVNVKDFGAVGNGVVDDTAAIQAAINYLETINGGFLLLQSGRYRISDTLNINSGYGVCLQGEGGDGIHDGGAGAAAATEILWFGVSNGTVFNFSSPSGGGNSRQYGSGLSDLKIDCRSVAGIALLANSVRTCNFHRLTIYNPTIAAVKTTTLGNGNLAEATDTQRCVFDRVSIRTIDTAASRAAHGFWLTSHSPVASNSNSSLNLFTQCDVQVWGGVGSGYGLFLEDGDNNTFMNLRINRASGTSVEAVRLVGNTNCDANYFWNLSAGGSNSITILGTASGFTIDPTKNSFWCADAGNGTQYPTADTGVIFTWHADANVFAKQAFNQVVLADSQTQARTQLSSLGNASALIFNGSSNHVVLTNGTATWGVNLDGSSGDLRMLRLAGSGSVNVGNGAPVKINNKVVTEGAIDSGGTGFRVLRVPN